MSTFRLVLLLDMLLQIFNSTVAAKLGEGKLIEYLQSRIEPSSRPRHNFQDPVEITIDFHVTALDRVDIRQQAIYVLGWQHLSWLDEFYQWDPLQYDNITELVLPRNEYIWIPDIVLENSFEEMIPEAFAERFKARVSHTGIVHYEPGGVFAAKCMVNIKFYPFDQQSCSFIFSSWNYPIEAVKLRPRGREVLMHEVHRNAEWTVHYTMKLKRVATYYFANILVPCIFLSFLVLAMFFLPPESGEKVSLGVTVLVAFSVFQLVIAENVPTSSNATPLLGVYLLCFMWMATFSVLIAVLVLNLHHRTEYQRPPHWARRLLLGRLARLVLVAPTPNFGVVPAADGSSSANFNIHVQGPSPINSREQVQNVMTMNHDATTPPHSPRVKIEIDRSRDSPQEERPLEAHSNVATSFSYRNARLLNQSIADLQQAARTGSRAEFTKAVREVYHELLSAREAGELENSLINEWKIIARVVDRLFFVLTLTFLIACTLTPFAYGPDTDDFE